MRLIYSPDPVRSAIKRGPSDGEFSLASAERYEDLIGGTLVLVGSASSTSKLRLLGPIDENTERNFCFNHFFRDGSLFEGVDMARGRLVESDNANDGKQPWEIDKAPPTGSGTRGPCGQKTLQIKTDH